MVRFLLTRLAFAVIALGAVASAQSKVAIINIQQAILDTAEIKKAQAALEAKFKPRQSDMERIQQELQALQTEMRGKQGKLTPQAEAELVARGQRRERDLQRMTEDLQADVDRERNDILQKAGQRMIEVVRKIAEERGLDVVVDINNTLYAKPALDMTKDASAAFDKAYPVK